MIPAAAWTKGFVARALVAAIPETSTGAPQFAVRTGCCNWPSLALPEASEAAARMSSADLGFGVGVGVMTTVALVRKK